MRAPEAVIDVVQPDDGNVPMYHHGADPTRVYKKRSRDPVVVPIRIHTQFNYPVPWNPSYHPSYAYRPGTYTAL